MIPAWEIPNERFLQVLRLFEKFFDGKNNGEIIVRFRDGLPVQVVPSPVIPLGK